MKVNKKTIQYRQTHNLIYNTMNELLQTKDYDSITIREICKSCNISIGNFYHHYKSKGQILDEGYHTFDHFVQADLSTKIFTNIKDKIIYLFSLELEAMEQTGLNFSTQYFKHQLTMNDPYIINKDRYFYQELLKTISDYIQENNINTDSESLLNELLRISRGTIYDWCLHKGDYDLKTKCIETLTRILDSYL